MKNRLPQTALTLLVAWIMLVLLSWILTALNPTADLRSLLSAEGIRWLFGRFVYTLSSPLLIWLVLGVMAYGPLTESQLFRLRRPLGVKERFALRVVMLELTIVVVIMAPQIILILFILAIKSRIEKIHIGNHYFRLGYYRFTMPFAFENVLNDVSSILVS